MAWELGGCSWWLGGIKENCPDGELVLLKANLLLQGKAAHDKISSRKGWNVVRFMIETRDLPWEHSPLAHKIERYTRVLLQKVFPTKSKPHRKPPALLH